MKQPRHTFGLVVGAGIAVSLYSGSVDGPHKFLLAIQCGLLIVMAIESIFDDDDR